MGKKYALVTGGTKGIGKSLVELLAKNKYNIITCSRNTDELQKLNKELEEKYKIEVFFSSVDLANKKDCLKFCSLVKDTVPHLDLLINNAGIFFADSVLTEKDEVFEEMFHANVFAPYYITKELFPLVEKKQGHIFNMNSVASLRPFENCGSYVATKHAMQGMTLSLREICKSKNVKVTSVLPGATFTASWAGVDIDPDRLMNPDSVAEAILACFQLKGNAVVEELVIRPQLGDL